MKLRYITCSDPREFNDIRDIVKMGQISPRVEIAVQAHPSKMSSGMPRSVWFHDLLRYLMSNGYGVNLAIHVNCEWCDQICRTGSLPAELKYAFDAIYSSSRKPVVKRWQLNMPHQTADNINAGALADLIQNHPDKEFILQYNENTRGAVEKLYNTDVKFSVLYDASGGRGILPGAWRSPVFENRSQGYSGGLSPENIEYNLNKIAVVTKTPVATTDTNGETVYTVKERNDIWIDAEGKLKTDDRFDIARARQYIMNAENWLAKQNQR